jgi:hypothetical protein
LGNKNSPKKKKKNREAQLNLWGSVGGTKWKGEKKKKILKAESQRKKNCQRKKKMGKQKFTSYSAIHVPKKEVRFKVLKCLKKESKNLQATA